MPITYTYVRKRKIRELKKEHFSFSYLLQLFIASFFELVISVGLLIHLNILLNRGKVMMTRSYIVSGNVYLFKSITYNLLYYAEFFVYFFIFIYSLKFYFLLLLNITLTSISFVPDFPFMRLLIMKKLPLLIKIKENFIKGKMFFFDEKKMRNSSYIEGMKKLLPIPISDNFFCNSIITYQKNTTNNKELTFLFLSDKNKCSLLNKCIPLQEVIFFIDYYLNPFFFLSAFMFSIKKDGILQDNYIKELTSKILLEKEVNGKKDKIVCFLYVSNIFYFFLKKKHNHLLNFLKSKDIIFICYDNINKTLENEYIKEM